MQDSLVDPKTVDVSSRVESLGLRHNFGKRASQRTIATDEDEEAAAQEKASQLLQAAVLEEEEQRRQHGKCWPASNSKPQAIYMVASGEGGSTAARIVAVVSAVATVAAVILSCLPPEDRTGPMTTRGKMEILFMIFFTLEYGIRLATARYRPDATASAKTQGKRCCKCWHLVRGFVLAPINVIDLLVVAPYWFEMMLVALVHFDSEKSPVLRLLRLVRLVRILRMTRYSDALTIFSQGMDRSRDYLASLLVLLASATVFSGTVVFEVEETYATKGTFGSVADTFTFALSELTTVGNSPLHPASPIGQAVGIFLMCGGIIFLGYGQAVLVQGFDQVIREHRRAKKGMKDLKRIFNGKCAIPRIPAVPVLLTESMSVFSPACRR